jgi:hypothetical protein
MHNRLLIGCASDDRRSAVQGVSAATGTDDVLARATNLLIARGVYQATAKMYPDELIELLQGARVIEKSKP